MATPPPPGVRPAASTARPATMAACAALVTTGRTGKHDFLSVKSCELHETKYFFPCFSSLSHVFIFLSQEWYYGLQRYRGAQFPWQHATSRPPALHSQQPPSDRRPFKAWQPARRVRGPTYPHHPRNNSKWQPSCWKWRHQRLRRTTTFTGSYCKDAVNDLLKNVLPPADTHLSV